MTQRSWAAREHHPAGSVLDVPRPVVPAPRSALPTHVHLPAQREAPTPRRPRAETAVRSWAPLPHQPADLRRSVSGPADLRAEGRFTLRWLLNAAVLLAVAALLALAVAPRTGAYRTTTMLTGSMRPLYPPGAVLVITPEPADSVAVGQVITFHAPIEDRRVVTHRIVSVDRSGSRPVLVTKGDANVGDDPWRATVTGDTVWRVRGVVPHVGSVIQALRTPKVSFALTRGFPGLLLVVVLVSLWRPERRYE